VVATAKTAAAAVYDSVRHAFDLPTAGLGLMLGSAASAATAGDWLGRWLVPGYFLGAMLVMSTMEMVTCYLSHPKADRRSFNWERSITGKLLLVSLVIVALLLDGMLYFGSRFVPGEWQVIGQGTLPITISSITWFIIAEAARAVRNVARSEGEGAIPPAVLWFIRLVKRVDEKRFSDTGRPGTAPSRWTDGLTEAQVAEIIERYRLEAPVDPNAPPPVSVVAAVVPAVDTPPVLPAEPATPDTDERGELPGASP
jgi:hypothetical protein